jgi:uncharacterized protein (TIGR02466 family)
MRDLFVTRLHEASFAADRGFAAFNAELADACEMLASEDTAGRAWCKAKAYPGYTSYASLDDLPRRATIFADLVRKLDREARGLAEALAFDLGARGRLKLDSLWVSVLSKGGAHAAHLHPHSVISGTYYVVVPEGAGGLRLEDPRLPMMMAAPPRRADAAEGQRGFVTIAPAAGDVLMWESWLRHEVMPGKTREPRVSISFNYAWA